VDWLAVFAEERNQPPTRAEKKKKKINKAHTKKKKKTKIRVPEFIR
jgi:hypothetical protein